MSRRSFSLAAGSALLVAAVVFLLLPALLDYDAFIPVLLAMICLFSAIAIFFEALSRR